MTGRARLALVAAAALALLPALLPHPFVLTIATQAAIWALLAAELIASELEAEPLPAEGKLIDAMSPLRFTRRAAARGLRP